MGGRGQVSNSSSRSRKQGTTYRGSIKGFNDNEYPRSMKALADWRPPLFKDGPLTNWGDNNLMYSNGRAFVNTTATWRLSNKRRTIRGR
ncbi:hypothetical protein AAK938_01360 [Aerococcaceae bacterium 50-4]